jgi:hypothetical protein
VVIEPEHVYIQTECWGGLFSNDGGLIGDKMRGARVVRVVLCRIKRKKKKK